MHKIEAFTMKCYLRKIINHQFNDIYQRTDKVLLIQSYKEYSIGFKSIKVIFKRCVFLNFKKKLKLDILLSCSFAIIKSQRTNTDKNKAQK